MLFSKATLFATAAAFSSIVSAQIAPIAQPGEVKVHVVQVGDRNGTLRFFPDDLRVEVGELVQFHFYPQNHSIAQSTFANPCTPISAGNSTTQGFFSGFMPVKLTDNFMPTFTIQVNQTGPIWYYCATGPHCQRGMVGVINAPLNTPDRTITRFRQLAANATTTVPGAPNAGIVDPDGTGPLPNTTIGGNGNGGTPANPTTTDGAGSGSSMLSINSISVVLGAVAAAFFLA
ncbi:Cupredoxin [Peziza echinospora]|nr:Cupredoxin [Peziza echinospora]